LLSFTCVRASAILARMVALTLHDHLRLTFGQVVYRHKAHSQIAHARARQSRWVRAFEALLMTAAAGVSMAAALGQGRWFAIAGAALAATALVVLILHLALDLDGSAVVHGACAARLWPMRERYRALLSDLADGAIDVDAARERRDLLMNELHGIYEQAPPADQPAYQEAGRAAAIASEGALSDEEINMFLPKSLHKAEKPATA
jgi:SMODS and SLOG-associating 2TM effector domain family 4